MCYATLCVFFSAYTASTWSPDPNVALAKAYALYLRTINNSLVRQQSKLKTELLKTKQELAKTSAQDQFAKWAKLRRSVDKMLSDLEKLSMSYLQPTLHSSQLFSFSRLETLFRKNNIHDCISSLPLDIR